MNNFTLLNIVILLFTMVSCSSNNNNNELITINIEDAIKNPTKIKASQLGNNIRYIPLESGDSSMFVGVNPLVRKYNDNIIIASAKNRIKVFDAKTGNYKNSVGMQGRGPNESNSLECFSLNPNNGKIYIDVADGKSFRVWDINGEFLETFTPQTDINLGGFASKISKVLVFNNPKQVVLYDGERIEFITTDGDKMSEILINGNNEGVSALDPGSIAALSVYKSNSYGSMSSGYGSLIINFNDGKSSYFLSGNENFWMYDNNLYIKDLMSDTAFVVNNTLIPRIVFDLGSYKLTPTERLESKFDADKKAIVGQVRENAQLINFELIYKNEVYYGIYNKKTKETSLSKLKDGVIDDINGGVDLIISYSLPNGEYLSIVDAIKIVDFNEDNPDKSSVMPNVNENDNCVIAIIDTK